MSTITAILEPDSDGTLRLQLPGELRYGKRRVTATSESANSPAVRVPANAEAIEKRLKAFARLRELNPFRGIDDPVAWQREARADVKRPGEGEGEG